MRIWLGMCLLVGIEGLCLRNAEACSTERLPPALVGYPKDGSTGVPTDVVPVFDRIQAWIGDPAAAGAVFELTSAAGEAIALSTRQSHVQHFELVPATPLQANTLYVLRGQWPLDMSPATVANLSLSFMTGAGPIQTAPPVPIASMQHYTLTTAALSSCDLPRSGTCVAHPTDTFVEHFYLDLVNDPSIYAGTFGVQGPYLYGQSEWTNLSGINQQTPYRCIRLRTRAADGTYSEPVVLCGKDAPVYRIEGSTMPTCTAQGLTHEGHLVTASEAGPATSEASPATGCSIANARTSGGWLLLLGLGCALAIRCRCRRSS